MKLRQAISPPGDFPSMSAREDRSKLLEFTEGCKYIVFFLNHVYIVNFQVYDASKEIQTKTIFDGI